MRQNLRRPGLYVVALALLLCTYTQTVRAADFGSIGGSPAVAQEGNERSEGIFIFTLKPGETGENGVRIDNNQKDERTVVIRVVDSIASNDGSFACRQDAEKKVGVSTWVKLEASQVTIPAGENKIVDLRGVYRRGHHRESTMHAVRFRIRRTSLPRRARVSSLVFVSLYDLQFRCQVK